MKNLILVALYSVLMSLSPLSAVANSNGCQSKGEATVVFTVTNGLGTKVGNIDIKIESFRNTGTGQESRRKFRLAKGMWAADKIPYGSYILRVRGDSFASTERPVDVCNHFVDVEVPTKSGTVRIATTLDWLSDSPGTKSQKQGELVQVISFQDENGTDFSKKFEKGEASNIPYGFYELQATGPIGGVIRREVDVFQSEVWVLAGFGGQLGDVDFSQPNQILHGVVKHIPESEKPIFVKLIGIRCEAALDGKVDADSGSFSMAISTSGCPYLLFTMGRSGILDAREISLPTHDEIEIDLDSAHRLFKP